jgi:ABC-type uncharacterized transport system ATPase subunit
VERVADEVVIVDNGRLLVSAQIDDLKQETRLLVVRRHTLPRGRVDLPGILSTTTDGAELVLTVQDRDGRTRRAIEDAGGEVVDAMGLSLEEIFIDMVHAGRREEAA